MEKTGLAKGSLYLTLASGLFIVVGYVTNIVLGRLLGPVNYGNYGVIVSLISLVNIIQTTGLTQSVAKYLAENEDLTDAIMNSALRLQLILTGSMSILFFLAAPLIAFLLNDETLTPYLKLAAFSFPLYGVYALTIDYNNGRHFFKKQALLNSIYSLTKALCVVGLGLLFHLKGVLWGFILAPLFSLFFGFYYPKSVKKQFPYKKLLLFSLPLIGYILFSTLLQSIDLYFVKALLVPESAGYYTASQNISRVLYFGTIAFSSVLLPSVSRSIKEGRTTDTTQTITRILRVVLIIITPLVALIAATSTQLLAFLYSDTYKPASDSLAILGISFGLFTLFTVICTILIAAGKPTKACLLAIVGLILNAIFCFLLIPHLLLTGAAMAGVFSNGIILFLAIVFVYRTLHSVLAIKHIVRIIGISLLIFVFAKLIPTETLLLPVFYLALFALYCLMLIVTKEVTISEFKLIQKKLI